MTHARPLRIHITGASGAGTTTLGAALAARIGAAHLDTDSFFWMPTDPPFATRRPVPERLALIEAAVEGKPSWVISGSLIGWGDVLIPRFDLVVFLSVPPEVRLARLREREQRRYGEAIEPGGRLHEMHQAFMAWASGYEVEDFAGRSRAKHRAWLAQLPCPVVEIEGTPSVAQSLERVMAQDPRSLLGNQ